MSHQMVYAATAIPKWWRSTKAPANVVAGAAVALAEYLRLAQTSVNYNKWHRRLNIDSSFGVASS